MSDFRRRLMKLSKADEGGGGDNIVLPNGYTRLKWIENKGSAYINSNFAPSDGKFPYSMEIDVQWNERNINLIQYFGSNYGFYFGIKDNSYVADFQTVIPVTPSITSFDNVLFERNIPNYPKRNLTINKDTSKSFDYVNIRANWPIFLFAISNFNQKHYCYCKLKRCIIKYNYITVRDYIPCKSPNGEVGMYDLIEGTFYGSATPISFIAGDEI